MNRSFYESDEVVQSCQLVTLGVGAPVRAPHAGSGVHVMIQATKPAPVPKVMTRSARTVAAIETRDHNSGADVESLSDRLLLD
jgi:hypothetical protein